MGSYLMDKELHCGLMKQSVDGQWLQLHNVNVFNVTELYTLKWYIWFEYFITVKKKKNLVGLEIKILCFQFNFLNF